MRRALLDDWPALSHFFGLHPWDVGGPRTLTVMETQVYQAAAQAAVQARTNHPGPT